MSAPTNEMVTIPRESLRELAKWAYAASHYDGQVPVETLLALPVAGPVVAEIAAANAVRESSDWSADFASI